jgi:C4-dicarboxylate-specific signal transduction histidine kinase
MKMTNWKINHLMMRSKSERESQALQGRKMMRAVARRVSAGASSLSLAGMEQPTHPSMRGPTSASMGAQLALVPPMSLLLWHDRLLQSSEEEEGEEEEGNELQPRYARRTRQTVQRYSPPRQEPMARAKASSKLRGHQQGGDSDSESEVRTASAVLGGNVGPVTAV